MGRTTFGFMLGVATTIAVGYAAYKALLAAPDFEHPVETVRRTR
jgi:hypothetical protein